MPKKVESGGFCGCVISRITQRPPGLRTRVISRIPAPTSARLRTPKPTVTASNDASE
jgi:hypothetical protein